MLSRLSTPVLATCRGFSSSAAAAAVSVSPLTGAIGAELSNVNLKTASDSELEEIKAALWDWGVVFFRDQHDLDNEAHLAFAKRMGTPDVHPIVEGTEGYPEIMRVVKEAGAPTTFGETWHSDNSYMGTPSMGSILRGMEIPAYGNDTLFANMYLAYESLSPGLQAMLEPLRAIHGAGRAFSTDDPRRAARYDGKADMKYAESSVLFETQSHPVVRVHPVTGRKALYVNSMFTYRFDGWTDEESAPLLKFLFGHLSQPQFQCRFRWQPASVAMWDNRCVQHVALGDASISRRVMQRITLEGDRPVGGPAAEDPAAFREQ